MIEQEDAIEDSDCIERTQSSLDLYLDGWKGGVMTDMQWCFENSEEAAELINELQQRLAAAEAKIPDKPLGVFSEGVWVFATTAQTFTAEDLDIAAFVKYRDHMKGGE